MQINASEDESEVLQTKILTKLDNLPFSRWHLFVVLALGLIWIFDGYQVTLVSLYRHQIEAATSEKVFKSLVTAYQVGGMFGSLIFGILAFIVGRRKIFLVTLALYFLGVMFSGIDSSQPLFILSRFLTGLSVGGQFTAIFTAVDEFMPPTYRGRVNIGIDGTWHLGGTMASLLTLLVDQTQWRKMFLVGWVGILALVIMRRNVPESPRWLLLKGLSQQASLTINAIVQTVQRGDILLKPIQPPPADLDPDINPNRNPATRTFCDYLREIGGLLWEGVTKHTRKFAVSFTLIFTQALFFNLIYYQYPDILATVYQLSQSDISLYMLPLSAISFLSTLFLGPLFDKIGRRKLLLTTYGLSGILLLVDYSLTDLAWRQAGVCLLFVFASPASSSANLIASEIFPTSSRTIMLFVMFIVSMAGGSVGVWFDNHVVASVMMIGAGVVAFFFCPDSENKSLEQIEKL